MTGGLRLLGRDYVAEFPLTLEQRQPAASA
jgi:hypothetical protein